MLDTIARILQDKQLELEAKGYTDKQAAAAIKRSRQWATRMSEMVSPEIREQAFIDLFQNNIAGAEDWIRKMKERILAA